MVPEKIGVERVIMMITGKFEDFQIFKYHWEI